MVNLSLSSGSNQVCLYLSEMIVVSPPLQFCQQKIHCKFSKMWNNSGINENNFGVGITLALVSLICCNSLAVLMLV